MNYTPERIKHIVGVLGRKSVDQYRETVEFLTGYYGTEITARSLENAFLRAGKKTPRSYMAPPALDPVVAMQEVKAERAAKSAVKELTEMLRVEREKNTILQGLARPMKPLAIPRRETKSGIREMTALALASDWHVEETVDPCKVQGRNKFTLHIADMRMKRFFQGVVDLVQHHRASGKVVIRDVVLCLMGDLITGHIHDDCTHLAQLFPIETILWLTPRIKAGIQFLLDELQLETLSIPCEIGNHGRTTEYRNIATGYETSYEAMLYVQLARDFVGEKRVRFDTSPANDHYTRIYDFLLHTTHGDSLRYAGGVGGLTIPLLKAVSAWDSNLRADWHAIGHFHTVLDVYKAIANGSMIGWGAYSQWIKCSYSARDLSQHFSLIDSKLGRCHSTQIWVSNEKEEIKLWSPAELATRNVREHAQGAA